MIGLVVVMVVSIWRTQTTLPLQIMSLTKQTEFTSVSRNETNSFEASQRQQEQKQQQQQQLLYGMKGTNHSKLVPTTNESTAPSSFLSICLLMKDDNDILPEWLSYHYHAVALRHLIIAIDPSSQTTPVGILERFTQHLPHFRFTLWSDVDYMPEWFRHGSTSGDDGGIKNGSTITFFNVTTATTTPATTTTTTGRVPNLVPKFWFVNASTSPFHQHLAQTKTGGSTAATTISVKQLEQDYNTINEYWFRQRTFLTECIKYIRQTHDDDNHDDEEQEKEDDRYSRQGWTEERQKKENRTAQSASAWMAHIDTDEYIVINPNLRGRHGSLAQELGLPIPTLTGSSVLNMLEQILKVDRKHNTQRLSRACIVLATILFGSVEDTGQTNFSDLDHGFSNSSRRINLAQWETLRWHYHADWKDHKRNGYPKVLMDVLHIPHTDHVWTDPYVFNPHQPSKTLCKRMTFYNDLQAVRLHPLVLYHYIGSWERYASRNDTRRNRAVRNQSFRRKPECSFIG
jgi:hypothetical protein